MKKISFVIPCYNEQESLPLLKRELAPVCAVLREAYDLEIILVDDGSTDRTWQFIMDWSVWIRRSGALCSPAISDTSWR
ncbi:MAG: glycosyltransferase [Lentisphaeria bacterium]|nr:glycosyltransferase [Lentisphaeria bacterium]MBR4076231.1 glycosyltransferase [Lentisphaeria bacterium]